MNTPDHKIIVIINPLSVFIKSSADRISSSADPIILASTEEVVPCVEATIEFEGSVDVIG